MGGKFEWPPMKDVVDYRRNVRQMILKIIDETPLSLPITRDSPWVCTFVLFVLFHVIIRCCGLQKKCEANDLEDNRRNSPISSNHQGLSVGVYLCPFCVVSRYHSESYNMLSKCPSELSSV